MSKTAISPVAVDALVEKIQRVGTTVNGQPADEHGDYKVNTVDFARQIVTDREQQSVGEYLFRTTGGDASLSDGPAKLISIEGRRVHTGEVQEVLSMAVNAAARTEPDEPITATIDHDTFVAYVQDSDVITLSYTSSWSESPALYGVTVTGTPINGDIIVITYVKADRGTITHSDPESFISTGWNLYDHLNERAKVKKYSDTYGYAISGSYSSLTFASTLSGTQSSVTPDANGHFQIAEDGYIFVNGGSGSNTAIWPTWSDWQSGYNGNWAAYTESEVDLSDIMTDFPYGLMQVGAYADEINFNLKKAISRIERMAYTSANVSTAIASGRDWEADTDYIYIVRAEPIEYAISDETGDYTASDHGLEIINGGTVGCYVKTLYGENIVDKITHDIPEQIEALNGKIETKTSATLSTASVTSGNVSIENCTYARRGNSGFLQFLLKATAQIAVGGTFNVYITNFPVYSNSTGVGFSGSTCIVASCGLDNSNANNTVITFRVTGSAFLNAYTVWVSIPILFN